MKRIVIMLCWLLPLIASAQEKPRINFSKVTNWTELLDEAKASNKPIFVDAFTTWCGPCKKMDQEVFTDRDITEFVNQNFVAIRIQMDSSKNDSKFLQNWRKEARRWDKRISGYPCFLIFTSSGEFAGLELGYHEARDFLTILKNAIDPEESYLAQINQFREGKLTDRNKLLALAYRTKNNKDTVETSVALLYKRLYLDPLPLDSMISPVVTKFIENFVPVFTGRDKIIRFMNRYPGRIDSISDWKNFARPLSDYIITQDYINSHILPGGIPIKANPEWTKMYKKIKKDFDKETAERIILSSRIGWAHSNNQFEEAIRYEFEKIDRYGLDTTASGRGFFNNMVYLVVFPKVNDPASLKKAASLMKYVNELENQRNSGYLDTYASILYKAGEKSKALEIENKALALATERNNKQEMKIFADTIERIEKGERIWEEVK